MKIEQLDKLKKDVEAAVKSLLGDKLCRIVLYGSYARGEFDTESDIDFAAIANVELSEIDKYHDDFVKIELELSLNYNIDVSILIISNSHLVRYGNVVGYYDNMIKEGKVLYGA